MRLRTLAGKIGVLASYFMLAAGALAATHYVSLGGTNNPNYLTWPDAATNIQLAVNAATNGETVLVSNGTYNLTNQITIPTNITVRSFSGNYSNTIVNGGWPTYTNRCFYAANSGTVDGFTISNGHYWASNDYTGGGGMFASNGVNILNCYFLNNACSNDGNSVGGGALYAYPGGTISNCTFLTNAVYSQFNSSSKAFGGGAYIYDRNGTGPQTRLVNCAFIGNYGVNLYRGGGLYSTLDGCNVISNCVFYYNYASYSCGGSFAACLLITDCIISNNSAGNNTGGIAVLGSAFYVLRNSTIVNNSALNSAGIAMGNTSFISNCVIAGNNSQGINLTPDNNNTRVIDSCKIYNNMGGGIVPEALALLNYGATIKNCYIHHNTNTTGMGGGIVANEMARNQTTYG